MLQTAYIKENRETVINLLKVRGIDATEMVDNAIQLDDKRKATQTELDGKLAEANQLAKEIGGLFKQGKAEEANAAKAKAGSLKEESGLLQEQMQKVQDELNQLLYQLPNVPHASVPAGNSDADNEVVSEHGKKKGKALEAVFAPGHYFAMFWVNVAGLTKYGFSTKKKREELRRLKTANS
ncbi:MAG: hypothetical protein ACPGD8_05250 [Flavobacteriales bacterium]